MAGNADSKWPDRSFVASYERTPSPKSASEAEAELARAFSAYASGQMAEETYDEIRIRCYAAMAYQDKD